MAKALGITRARYSKYEYGQAEPPFELLVNMSAYFGVGVDDLLSSDVAKNS
ncbi:helix-turn-helix domain-containing protein [Sphingobacterium paludis]|uniref:helix-turn-helix domain-containing protein n=1 Tax=Sphingobacterium paludis TaxID=1476465 RepID=UPI00105F8C81|nr:helix-turn-helix transcriptional regulator [Sphingobacterium paludis]